MTRNKYLGDGVESKLDGFGEKNDAEGEALY